MGRKAKLHELHLRVDSKLLKKINLVAGVACRKRTEMIRLLIEAGLTYYMTTEKQPVGLKAPEQGGADPQIEKGEKENGETNI